MKRLYIKIKREICVLVVAAMLCTDTGMVAFATEGLEQNNIEDEIEMSEKTSNEGDMEGGVTGNNSVSEDTVPEENTDLEDEETLEDVSDGEVIALEEESDTEVDGSETEDFGTVMGLSEDDIIASGESNDITWVIDADGKLTVEGTGDFERESDLPGEMAPWYNQRMSIKSAEINVTGMTDASYMFYGCENLTSLDVSNFDTSDVTDMGYMFYNCRSLTSVDVGNFDTSNVTDMSDMFTVCSGLKSLDLSNFNTSNVTDMGSMFYFCFRLESLDVSGFDTSNVTDMSDMFYSCSSLESLDVSGFDTSNVTDMSDMFDFCSSLESLDVSNFDTSNVTDMGGMFSYCSSLESLDVSGFDTSNVTDMIYMFWSCYSLTSLNVSGFDTSNVTNIGGMFWECSSLKSLDVSGFDTGNVTDMGCMFSDCSSLTSIDVSGFDVRNVINIDGIFSECSSLKSLDMSSFDVRNMTDDLDDILDGCISLTTIYTPYNLNSWERVSLPKSKATDIWIDEDGNEYEELPQNLDHSILLTKSTSSISENTILSDENATVTLSDTYDYVYDGQPKTPEVTVDCIINDTRVTLEPETDYIVTYENNINAFEDSTDMETAEDAPKVIITGQNEYSGTVSQTFYILKADAPEDEEQTVYIEDCSVAQEGCTLDISRCFADYHDKTGYAVGTPVEDDAITGSVLSGEVSIDENAILTYNTAAGTAGDFAVIPVVVSFSNHKEAVVSVKIVMETDITEEDPEPSGGDDEQPESGIHISLDRTNITMYPGETEQVTATVLPENTSAAVVWKSSDQSVATVNEDGVISAKAEGIAQITVQCGGAAASVNVEVEPEDDNKLVDLSGDIWIAGFKQESDDFVYTGSKITQDIRVYHNNTLLKEKTDYTLSYKNNINAAAYNSAKAPSVKITMKGQYSGSVTLYYTIKPVDINSVNIYNTSTGGIEEDGSGEDSIESAANSTAQSSAGYEQAVTYSKNLKIPSPELTFGKKKLTVNKDFVCDYTTLPENYKKGDSYETGKVYEYTVNGTGNFTGAFKMRLVVVQDKSCNFSSATVTLGQKQYEYHGTALSNSDVTIDKVTLSKTVLDPKFYAYEVCANQIDGAYVMVYPNDLGRSAGYHGYKKVSLKLVGDRNIGEAASGENWQESIAFSQEVLNADGGIFQAQTGVLTFGTGAAKETLTEGEDYTVKYSNAKKAGTATVTFTGKGRYKGTLKKKYTITPNADQNNFTIVWKNVTWNGNDGEIAYRKGGAAPDFDLMDQDYNVLKIKTDYTVKVTNNKTPKTAMTCEITGKGNYKGYTKTVQIMVTNGDISLCTISIPDKAYSTKNDAWKAAVTIKDINGKKLAAGTDYDKAAIIYEYAGMESGQPPQAGTTVKVTVNGTGCYEGSRPLTGSYRIYKNSISKLKVTIDAQEYTGEEITLSDGDIHVYATAADKRNNIELKNCYEIIEYKNNIKAGTAKVTLRGTGDYGGTKTYSFKIQKKKYLVNSVKKIALDKTSLALRLAEKEAQLTATITPEDTGEKLTNPTIIWSTSNSNVAAVDTVVKKNDRTAIATIVLKKEGTATITATAQDGSKKAQCKITIVDVPVLQEAGQTIEGEAGSTYQLTVIWDNPEEANPASLVWESNNPDKVSVDKNGLVTMKETGAAVIKMYAGTSKYVQECDVVVKGEEEEVLPEGKALVYRKQPGSVDDTKAINQLLRSWEWNPNAYDYMYIPAGVYRIDAVSDFGGIVLTDNQKLIMSPGALLVAIPNGKANYQVIYGFGRNNITISGGQIIGERNEHTGSSGEWGHGISIQGCTNVHISDVDISQCWGDGIYLGAYNGWDANGNAKRYDSKNITIENCNLHHNRRNNLSITDASNVTIDRCQFNNAKGTDPQYGIDIEPNYSGTCKQITISNSTFKGNAKASMGIITPATDIRLENCTLDGAFYNMAGKNVVLKNTTIKGPIEDPNNSIKRE